MTYDSNKLRAVLIVCIAIAGSLYLGVGAATAQMDTVIKVMGSLLLLTCVFLGRKIWLLLIFFMALNVPIIRGFGTLELGQFLLITFTFLMFLMRRQPFRFQFRELEVWMLLLVLCIVQVYLRNPVGLNMFGASSVGARPYFMAAMAFLSAMILANIVVKPEEIKWAMRLSIIGSFLGMGISVLPTRVTGMEAGISVAANKTLGDNQESGRIGILSFLGNAIARVVVSFVSPLRALFHPLWAPLFLISLAAAAGSGYRNSVASVGLIYLVGLAYRGGFASVFIASISGMLGIAALALWNVILPLPPNIQRALSPFPGTWEKRQIEGADASTEWRVEMWKEALFTDHWIQNKILGDGLGLTARELKLLTDIQQGNSAMRSTGSGLSQQQESMMLTGGYHSGPVETVKTVGYVGLIILLIAMIRVAVHAHRQIMRCRGTEWYPLALFFGIPTIVLPIFFVLVFGTFGKDVAVTFLSYGIIRLLEKNLPLPAFIPRKKELYVPQIMQKNQPVRRLL
jgi:hypothetical protein